MKSGLEGRNNWDVALLNVLIMHCLNEVRPRRPEQYRPVEVETGAPVVSMKSGLEGRNNDDLWVLVDFANDHVSMKSGLEGRNNPHHQMTPVAGERCLNEVRPRRPEQSAHGRPAPGTLRVSMKSGLEGRNNAPTTSSLEAAESASQ
mgnify:CR=1 FL=1